ncbi:EAL domain-containing protein [Sutcliffiella deserti]|uniref:EAL domain-containing protein n=1 Tax=Sutcliffiella deserti TaxID=2875501 RepID=UPI001CBC71B1|nr:EAL domain-containing protein [Sutcliffiella deserti]
MFGRLPLYILALIIIVFFAWNIAFGNKESVRTLGLSVLQGAGALFSFIMLVKAYFSALAKQKPFWLMLCVGMFLYIIANVYWIIVQLNEKTVGYPETSFFIWILSYIVFLVALVYKIRKTRTNISTGSYLFNLFVFMTTAAAFTAYYLIHPIITLSDSIIVTATTAAYPITSLGILFVTTTLYHISQSSPDKNIMQFIIFGFFIQVAADFGYSYLVVAGNYTSGNIVDLLWILSILLIGFAGLYAKGNEEDRQVVAKNPERKEIIFPYVSVIILLVLVLNSYQWNFNALSFGLLITFFMILGRQFLIIHRNEKLVSEFKFLAYHDPLTKLHNRVSFKKVIDNLLEKSKADRRIALLLIDLDRFKVVNDTLGHYMGDIILVKTSERLKETLEGDAQLFRIGGDEFVIVLQAATEEKCSLLADALLKKFTSPFLIDDHEIIITPSIGISIYPENGESSEDLLKHADAAMYLAKENGKNNYRFYNTELNNSMARKMNIENGLRKAIEHQEFIIHYQPKIELQTQKIVGMEALLRWEHPELGIISPAEFIPIAEETGQIVLIGEWVLKTACKQNKAWQEAGFPSLCVSVNVSVRQFQHNDFLCTVNKVLQETKLCPSYLELEITESIVRNVKDTTEVLNSLRNLGVKTSIDDFGTGYSSLHILQKLPIDTIKIDKTFIDEIGKSNQQSMVKAIIDLGLNLNLTVVAEGIEHDYQLKALLDNKCNIGQGYLFSKALPPKEFERVLGTGSLSQTKLEIVQENNN